LTEENILWDTFYIIKKTIKGNRRKKNIHHYQRKFVTMDTYQRKFVTNKLYSHICYV